MSNTTVNNDSSWVTSRRIFCDGGDDALGHPRIWMDMGIDNQVRCKYCDRLYRLKPDSKTDDH